MVELMELSMDVIAVESMAGLSAVAMEIPRVSLKVSLMGRWMVEMLEYSTVGLRVDSLVTLMDNKKETSMVKMLVS